MVLRPTLDRSMLLLILRAVNVLLAHGGQRACRAVIVLVIILLGLHVPADGVRDRLVRTAGLVLVDHGPRSLSCPMRVIRSRRFALLDAANV